MSDDEFEPRLGKIRARGSKRGQKYLGRVLAAVALAGGIKSSGKSRFDGSRIGRGASIGRILGSRDRLAGLRARRGVIKARIIKLAGKGAKNAAAHLRYIQRDGVTRGGQPGQLYAADKDVADGKEFIERGREDRHQFRFIVSAEDGDQYDDLKPLTRRLMAQMESDLGTKLDWVAVDHFNTGHPHTHIMMRGVDDRDQNLIIAREYIGTGMRERLAELVERDLGPRTTLEIEQRLRHDISADRLTATDRRMIRDMDADHSVTATDRDPFQQSLRAGRLQKLKSLGLAEPQSGGRWLLHHDLESTLRQMGERGDIISTMQRELSAHGIDRAPADQWVHAGNAPVTGPIIGRLVMRGLSDEHQDRHYLIIDGVDGHSHYVDIGKGEAVEPLPAGAIVEIAPRSSGVRQADRTIAEVAAASGGHYDVDLHLKHDPSATEKFADTHVRRLEAMRRTIHSVERGASGTWKIAPDHLELVAKYEARLARDQPVSVTLLSTLSLDQQVGIDAAVWLDRDQASSSPIPIREAGFGGEVRQAQQQRQIWLIAQGLADERDGQITYDANLVTTLQRRELVRVAGQLSRELGLSFVESPDGEKVSGILKRHIDLASGKFALIEKSREFSLVPWAKVLERQIGKEVAGIVREGGISWTIGRQRSGPVIS
jgi:type IV secretory pathway VirD2 relaxase